MTLRIIPYALFPVQINPEMKTDSELNLNHLLFIPELL